MACVLHGDFTSKDQPKVAFYLAPWAPAEEDRKRYTAHVQMPVFKVGELFYDFVIIPTCKPSYFTGTTAATGTTQLGTTEGPLLCITFSPHYLFPTSLKVKAYILQDEKLRKHLEPPAGAAGVGTVDDGRGGVEGASPHESPEDSVEVLCGDRVLEPHLYIGERRDGGGGG
ncbi:unnamed protein product [Laminaria digitata]